MNNLVKVCLLLFFFPSISFSQRVFTDILISDQAGGSKILVFGLDTSATDEIDTLLGEINLPPFPPTGTFEARFFLPENGFLGTLSSYKDFRFANFPYTGQKEFRLAYQVGAGTVIKIDWNFPPDMTGLLQYNFGGIFINQPMLDSGSYTVTNPGVVSRLKMFINYNASIPVELVSFVASVQGNSANLTWQTASELNNSGFDIERKTENTEWNKIGFVQGAGTTTESRSYSFNDTQTGQGIVSYKLKQIDFDGKAKYSKVISVDFNSPENFNLIQNYPNPFNPNTNISYSIATLGRVTLKIYDILGREVLTLVNEEKPAGRYEVNFNASSLASGVYFYQLRAGNFIQSKKMLLAK